MSTAVTATYVITRHVLSRSFKLFDGHSKATLSMLLIAATPLLCFTITGPYSPLTLNRLYIGRIVPNVWHNSTIILVFPFGILLFLSQISLMTDKCGVEATAKQTARSIALVFLNIIIKPSFILAYIPATSLILAISYWKGKISPKHLLFNFMPLVFVCLILLAQSFLIYKLQLGSAQLDASSMAITMPFEVVRRWLPIWLIPIGWLLSFALPIAAAILRRDILADPLFSYALVLQLFGGIISTFLKETGPRMFHGNFLWQNVVC